MKRTARGVFREAAHEAIDAFFDVIERADVPDGTRRAPHTRNPVAPSNDVLPNDVERAAAEREAKKRGWK